LQAVFAQADRPPFPFCSTECSIHTHVHARPTFLLFNY